MQVQGAFTGGGNSQGKVLDTQNHVEIHNLTSITSGKHYFSFGGRVRDVNEWNSSTGNFNGTFTFASLAAYQSAEATLLACQQAGQSACQASGASQFSLTAGNPVAAVNWIDLGLYAEDQWRIRSNMSLNLGLRYETQNSIHDRTDFAPRVGFAWALGHGNSAKTVLRTGFGVFYDRFQESQVLEAKRLNGVNQTQYIVTDPDFFPNIPLSSELAQMSANTTANTTYQIDPNLRAPYTVQGAVGVERQVTKNATVSVTYLNSHGVHQLMTRNINAPLPGTYVSCSPGDTTCTPSAGTRPYGDVGNIYQYESDGLFNQNQLITNLNLRLGTKFSLFGFYSLNFANSNTSGVSSFPSNSYDVALDYGRAAFDVRHRLFLGGSFSLPKGIRLSPFMMANSGSPFNITTGQDNNGDSIFNDRPAYARRRSHGNKYRQDPVGNVRYQSPSRRDHHSYQPGDRAGAIFPEPPAEQDDRSGEENREQNSRRSNGAAAGRGTGWTAGRWWRPRRRSWPRRAEQQRRTWRAPRTECKLSLQPDLGHRGNERLQHCEFGGARRPTQFAAFRQVEFAGIGLRPPRWWEPPDRLPGHVQLLIAGWRRPRFLGVCDFPKGLVGAVRDRPKSGVRRTVVSG